MKFLKTRLKNHSIDKNKYKELCNQIDTLFQHADTIQESNINQKCINLTSVLEISLNPGG